MTHHTFRIFWEDGEWVAIVVDLLEYRYLSGLGDTPGDALAKLLKELEEVELEHCLAYSDNNP